MDPKETNVNQENISDEAKELAKAISPIMKEEVKEWTKSLKEAQEETSKVLKEVQDEMKTLKLNSKKDSEEVDENLVKTIIVNTFKQVKKLGVSSEEQFKEVFEAQVKETYQNTATAWDGAEFVFEQFSKDVYAIFEKFDLVKELNQINITGTSINLPRYDWGVEAYYVDEGWNFTASKGGTWNLKIDVYKLGALITFTDEMLKDGMTVPTLYKLIITEIGVKFAGLIENEVLNGTTKILGVLPYTWINEKVSTATSFANISENDILDADAEIDDKYDINPENKVAVMLKATFNSFRQERDANGVLVYPELRNKTPEMLGYRVIKSKKMPAQATNAVGVLLGNFKDFYYYLSKEEFSSEMWYLNGDFQWGKKSLRVDQRKGWAPKDIKAFAVVKIWTVV